MRLISKSLPVLCLLALFPVAPTTGAATGPEGDEEHCQAYWEARHEVDELTAFREILTAQGKAKSAKCLGDPECLRGLDPLRAQVRMIGQRASGKRDEMLRQGALCEEVRRQDAKAFRALEAKAAKACTPNGDAELCEETEFERCELGYRLDAGAALVARERYEKAWELWRTKDGRVDEPALVRTSYDRSIAAHERYLQDNPTGKRRDLVLYRLACLQDMRGASDEAASLLTEILRSHPASPHVPVANLRLGEIHFLRKEYDSAIACYGRVEARQEAAVDNGLLGLALFHKGEAFFHLARYDKARDAFFDHVEGVEKKRIKRGDLRVEGILFMAQCFAASPTSYEDAEAFFAKAGHRSYEDTLLYEVAMRHFDREQWERAVGAFEHLLEAWPGHVKAPMAQLALVEALTRLRRDAQAQAAKEVLVSTYATGAPWWNGAPKLDPRDRKRLDEAIAGYRFEASWK